MSLTLDLQLACRAEIPAVDKITHWLEVALQGAGFNKPAELTLRVVDKQEIQQLNSQYRGQDKTTNILSFPFEKPENIDTDELQGLLGDLIICAEVLRDESIQQSKSLEAHWAHLCIHGTLHLLGYDHIETDDTHKMESLEIDLLASLGYADPYTQNTGNGNTF